jgi:regulator of ribonuclease activity A
MSFSTCDLCDAHEDQLANGSVRVLPPGFHSFGKVGSFAGAARTLKVFEDNALVRSTLETPGENKVLVVDGGGSLRSALVGGNLGALAEKNGWAGVLVYGSVRDTVELQACNVGIFALATIPRRSARKGVGETDAAVTVAGVIVHPGEWIYADDDGVLISNEKLV